MVIHLTLEQLEYSQTFEERTLWDSGLVSRSQTHPTASEGKGLETCHTTTRSSTTGCLV